MTNSSPKDKPRKSYKRKSIEGLGYSLAPMPGADPNKKRGKRFVSEEEKKKRRAQLAEARKIRIKKLKEKKEIETSQDRPMRKDRKKGPRYGHTKDIRKDNINIVIRYRPWPHQYRLSKAIESGKRFIAFVAGIRSGKSFAGARECLGQIYGGQRRSGLGWIVAPTYDLSKVAQRAFEEAAGARLILKKRIAEKEYLMRPAREGEPPYLVQVRTAEHPDRLRGAEVDWVWWDEAAMCDEEVFDILMGRVMTTRGKIWMTTTPQGMSHWLYSQVVKRAEAGEKDYAVIKAKTEDNQNLEAEDIARLRDKYTDEFALQELEGEFVNFSGLIYKDFDQSKHIFELGDMDTKHEETLAGIDWGYDDPFVFLWIGMRNGVYYVLDEYFRSGEIPKTHLEVIKRNPLTKYTTKIFADVSRPESRREFQEGLGQVILPGRSHREDMIPGIEYVSSLFKQGRLKIARHCRHIISELGKYSWRDSRSTNSQDKPRDAFNHCLDALRYALYSHRNVGPAKSSIPLNGRRRLFSIPGDNGIIRKIRQIQRAERRARNPHSWMEV